MLHLKELYCTKIVHIRACCEGQMGTGGNQELAAIVPGSYYTRGIWARQEKLARSVVEFVGVAGLVKVPGFVWALMPVSGGPFLPS